MISTTTANSILKALMGQQSYSLGQNAQFFIGLCADSPAKNDGTVNSEPTAKSYKRKLVVERSNNSVVGTTNCFASSYTDEDNSIIYNPADGKIVNTAEIQMNTALEDFVSEDGKPVMKYWFLSDGNATTSKASVWGVIKDIIMEKKKASFSGGTEGAYEYTVDPEGLLDLKAEQSYIINWNGKDYGTDENLKAEVYTEEGTSYIKIAHPDLDAKEDFTILYYTSTLEDGVTTTGHLKIRTPNTFDDLNVGIYGIGITVRKNTVPTFYKYELQASIDAN